MNKLSFYLNSDMYFRLVPPIHRSKKPFPRSEYERKEPFLDSEYVLPRKNRVNKKNYLKISG